MARGKHDVGSDAAGGSGLPAGVVDDARTWPPGSRGAIANGCECAELDNARGQGRGRDADGRILYWISPRCPLHGGAFD